MKAAALIAELQTDQATLRAWIRDGLPHTPAARGRPREFDPAAVRAWLLANGLAAEPNTVETLTEVAGYFGRHERTVKTWRAAGMPGRPGAWDLDAIETWLAQRGLGMADETRDARARFWAARADAESFKVGQLRGDLIEADPVARAVAQQVNTAKAILEQLPDLVAGLLPDRRPTKKDRETIRRRARKLVDDSCQALADLADDLAGMVDNDENE